MEIKCKKCGYEWDTKTQLIMISCPSCGMKNKVPKSEEGVKNDTKDKKDVQ